MSQYGNSIMHKEIMFIANPSNEGNGIHSARDTPSLYSSKKKG